MSAAARAHVQKNSPLRQVNETMRNFMQKPSRIIAPYKLNDFWGSTASIEIVERRKNSKPNTGFHT